MTIPRIRCQRVCSPDIRNSRPGNTAQRRNPAANGANTKRRLTTTKGPLCLPPESVRTRIEKLIDQLAIRSPQRIQCHRLESHQCLRQPRRPSTSLMRLSRPSICTLSSDRTSSARALSGIPRRKVTLGPLQSPTRIVRVDNPCTSSGWRSLSSDNVIPLARSPLMLALISHVASPSAPRFSASRASCAAPTRSSGVPAQRHQCSVFS